MTITTDDLPPSEKAPWERWEAITHDDPAARGIAGLRDSGRWLDAGQLAAAAVELARNAHHVAIVTGFPVLNDAGAFVAESDGPPGSLYLAAVLDALHVEVTILAESFALPALRVGCELASLPASTVCELTGDLGNYDRSLASEWTHLVAIERCGPSHTVASMMAQRRTGPAPVDAFAAEVPSSARDRCHNMRGADITPQLVPISQWFERPRGTRPATIGIGDGGNEIGLGNVPWEIVRTAFGNGGRIACRVATDHWLLAGVSNWAAYALALGVAWQRHQVEVLRPFDTAHEARIIEELVATGGLVDGVTGRALPTVDGLRLTKYLAVLGSLRQAMNLPA